MLSYHKQSLINLFSKLQLLQRNPANADLCWEIQELLLKKLSYVEKKVRGLKIQVKDYKIGLAGGQSRRLTKVEASEIKAAIKECHRKIDDYQYLQRILKSIGDGLAFTYINKWDIKPMSFKESPGGISGKSGGKLEREIVRSMFRSGVIAILNDLTNTLRYGDVTAITENGFKLLEVKSIKSELHLTDRIVRQAGALEKIERFLVTDRVIGLYEIPTEVFRSPLKLEEVNYRAELNELIEEALVRRHAWRQIEEGLFYYVDYGGNQFAHEATQTIAQRCIGKPTVFYDEGRLGNVGYFPYTLSITKPEALFAFYSGELSIFVVIDLGAIVSKLTEKGIDVQFGNDDEWALHITVLDEGDDRFLRVSRHMFERVPYEFLSLEWFLDDFSQRLLTLHEMFEGSGAA